MFSVRRLVVRRTFMQGFSLGKDSRMKEMGMQALGKVKMKSVRETSLGVAQALIPKRHHTETQNGRILSVWFT